jgi:microcystin-dependent protein
MPIQDWSTTADSNTTLEGISWAEGMLPSGVNNGVRAIAAAIRAGVANKGGDIASGATINLGAATGQYVRVTGTTTITALGTVAAGTTRDVLFGGALTLTHNGTSLILPGAANITTAAGDVARFVSEGSGNWRCLFYSRGTVAPPPLVANTVPVGVVSPYAGVSAPTGWLYCYGQAVSRTTYALLFAALSTTYGTGDGSTTFNLPDMRGRAAAGKDNMGGVSANRLSAVAGSVNGDVLGSTGGLETQAVPSHTHTFSDSSSITGGPSANQSNVGNQGTAVTVPAVGHTHTVAVSGTTSAPSPALTVPAVQPTIVLNYIIYAGV